MLILSKNGKMKLYKGKYHAVGGLLLIMGHCAPLKERGAIAMVTYSELFQFCLLIVAIISLIVQIIKHKK